MKSFITKNRILCIILAVTMTVGMVSVVLADTNDGTAAACGHVHDGDCDYLEPREEVPCDHVHNVVCEAEWSCGHTCYVECNYDDNGICLHTHTVENVAEEDAEDDDAIEDAPEESTETCAFVSCTHSCEDGSCNYAAAFAGSSCTVCPECNPDEVDGENDGEVDGEDDDGNENGNVDWAGYLRIYAKNTPRNTGETISFQINSFFASPGTDEASDGYPGTMEFIISGISSPFDLVMNNATYDSDTGEYMFYADSTSNDQIVSLYYSEQYGTIRFTLEPGDSYNPVLSFTTPNGITDNNSTLYLTASYNHEAFEEFEASVDLLDASATVTALFGWEAVEKVFTSTSKDELSMDINDMQDLNYRITAQKMYCDNGTIYTKEYSLVDTIDLGDTCFNTNGTTAESKADGTDMVFYIGDVPIIRVSDSTATITAVYESEGSHKITGFTIEYTNELVDDGAKGDIENLYLTVTLYLKDTSAYYKFDTTSEEGYSIDNKAKFEAMSYFYSESSEEDKDNPQKYHESNASAVATISGSDIMIKSAYGDVETAKAAVSTEMTNGTYHISEYGDDVFFTIYYKNNNKQYSTLNISDILVTTDKDGKPFYLDKIEIVSIKVIADGQTKDYTENELDWTGKTEIEELDADSYENISSSYDKRKAIAMYKTFEDLPYGAEIYIVYKVTMIGGNEEDGYAARGSYGINASYASESITEESYTYDDLLASGYTYVHIEPEETTLTISKSYTATDDQNKNGFKEGDTITFLVEITNTSESTPVSISRFVENWPFEQIKLTKIEASSSLGGTPWTGLSLVVYDDSDNRITDVGNPTYGNPYTTWPNFNYQVLPLWAEYSKEGIDASYFTIESKTSGGTFSIAANETITLTLTGTVVGSGKCENKVWLEYPTGEGGTGNVVAPTVEVKIRPIIIAATKLAYRIDKDKETNAMLWDGFNAKATPDDYEIGDIVRYEITVTNKSKSTDIQALALNDIYVVDALPAPFRTNGVTLVSGTYTSSKEGATESGYVIAEYPDGTLKVLVENTGMTSSNAHTSYKILASNNNIEMAVSDANLAYDESIKFHIFLEITKEVYEAYIDSTSSSAMQNGVTCYARAVINNVKVSVSKWTSYTIKLISGKDERKANVTKSVYAVIKGLKLTDYKSNELSKDSTYDSIKFASDGEEVHVEPGDYIVYSLKFDNVSPVNAANKDFKIYSITDKLPKGTEFVGFTASVHLNTAALLAEKKIDWIAPISSTKSINLDSSGVGGTITGTPVTGTVSYDDVNHIATFTPSSYTLTRGTNSDGLRLGVFVIAKVEDEYDEYHNEGGFIIDESITTDNNKSEQVEDTAHKYVYDTADIGGPYYSVGIEKAASQFRESKSGSWISITNSSSISPSSQIIWSIKLTNNYVSSGDIKAYTVTDILPVEFTIAKNCFTSGASYVLVDADGNEYSLDSVAAVDTSSDEDGRTVIKWTITSDMTDYIIPVGKSVTIKLATEWNYTATIVSALYGTYDNEARLTLLRKIDFKASGEWLYDSENKIVDTTICAEATVDMTGGFGTKSYKTIENITGDSSPYNGQNYSAITGKSGSIPTLPGDTIKYTLNIKSSSNSNLENMVIIDVLPHVGDSGVVNASRYRNSYFGVNFADEPNVSVVIVDTDGVTTKKTLSVGMDFTIEYGLVPDKTRLSAEGDWGSAAGNAGWSATKSNTSNAIRITLINSNTVGNGETVIISFEAVVPQDAPVSTTNGEAAIAWNSFGYKYIARDGNNSYTLYSEPVKVGVRVPTAVIEVKKTVQDAEGKALTDNTEEFSFQLMKLTGDDPDDPEDWSLQKGISYTKTTSSGDISDTIGESGVFTLKQGETVKLYLPADMGTYKVVETAIPNNYELDVESSVMAIDLLTEGTHNVSVVNKYTNSNFDVVLKKINNSEDALSGAKFTLEKKDLTAVTDKWDYIKYSEDDIYYTTVADSSITFTQLEAGTYRIKENVAPEGYALLESDIIFTLVDGKIVKVDDLPFGVTFVSADDEDNETELPLIEVVNYMAYALPETGGGGLLIFTAIGFALLMTGALLLVNLGKKKKA